MRLGCPEELLCVGNFALISESLEGSKRKRKAWKGARINLMKVHSVLIFLGAPPSINFTY